ncbi:MAG: hypothetical protein QM405_00005 [Euryarchaeota archaeon]|nr:hypothetical protein [Euryarchaeota archaeon]
MKPKECMTCGKPFTPSSRVYNNCPDCIKKHIHERKKRNRELLGL